jgi:hypothetical protein
VRFEVWRENWPIVELFLAMSTQWLWTGGMEPRRCGLNYAALPFVYEGLRVPRQRRAELFQGLQVMEVAALEALHAN